MATTRTAKKRTARGTVKPGPPSAADPATLGFTARRLDVAPHDVRAFDEQVRAGLRRFLVHQGFDPGEPTTAAIRDVMKPAKADPEAVRKRAARDGHRVAQFRPEAGLRASGFGVWAHLRGLEMGLTVTEQVARAWGYRHSGSACHLIAKLPCDDAHDWDRGRYRAGTLAPHIDGGSFADAYAACQHHAQQPDFEAWGQEHGEQMLAHVQIGRTGHTCTLWHLTPWSYAVVLTVMRQSMPAERWTTTGGPQFYKHDMAGVAATANAVIAHLKGGPADGDVAAVVQHLEPWVRHVPPHQQGVPDLVAGPMVDMAAAWAARANPEAAAAEWEASLTAPTVVAWKVMVVHWVTPTGPMPRYTFTLPLSRTGCDEAANRGLEHLRLVAAWKDADTPEERQAALARIGAVKYPWAGGQVHKFPGCTEAANIGFWEDAMAGRARVEEHIRAMEELDQ